MSNYILNAADALAEEGGEDDYIPPVVEDNVPPCDVDNFHVCEEEGIDDDSL
jgi:hypothetical protein